MDRLREFLDMLGVEPGGEFTPYDLNLDDYVVAEDRDEGEALTLRPSSKIVIKPITPMDLDMKVIAIDSSGVRLGEVKDGVVGAIRATVIVSTARNDYKINRYGPYLIKATNQNAKVLYNNLRKVALRVTNEVQPPSPYKLIDRARSFLEKIIQYNVVGSESGALILFDGSLISGTVDTPKEFVQNIISLANRRNNNIVAISKRTSLTLKPSKRSILSVLEDNLNTAYANVKMHIEQDPSRYLGDIYVCRYIYGGMVFRTDIPSNAPVPHDSLIGYVSRLCGRLGYPEELRLAHMYSKINRMEYLELQSAAVHKFDMKFRARDIRRELFGPFR